MRNASTRFLVCCLVGPSLLAAPDPVHPLQDKHFFLLSAIERTPEVRALIHDDAVLARLAAFKRASLSEAPQTCASDIRCFAAAVRRTEEEIAQARSALAALGRKPAMNRFVEDVLRPSGVFERYHADRPAVLLEKAWEDAARKMNRAIDVFALGESPFAPAGTPPGPRSPAAPSGGPPRIPQGMELTTYDVGTPAFSRMMQIMTAVVAAGPDSRELFFQPALKFSVELFLLHGRDEAARHEPLESGENRAALARIRSIDWARYPYTAILVLGSGPDRPGVPLSPIGRLRLVLAARQFRAGKAPLLIVSGGYVYPRLTPYSEAMEMKKALQTEFGIPEEAILVDPHARRTTTNLRNASRLIFRSGIPAGRKGLILTDQLHIAAIEHPAFRDRCFRDFGYMPVRLGSRVSAFELEFEPSRESLHVDAVDLLDP